MSETKKPGSGPTTKKGDAQVVANPQKSTVARQNFLAVGANMGWQLALVVLVPVIGGVELDKAFGTADVYTLIGLTVALIASGLVMWRTVQVANRLPVPKLTATQKRAVQKSYEEDDD